MTVYNTPLSPTNPVPNGQADADSSAGLWACRLTSVLDERARLLAELDAASSRQGAIIESRDTTLLLELLAGRQKIVDRFVAGQPELLALTDSFEDRIAALTPQHASELRTRMRELSEGLARVTARDEVAQTLLREARDEAHEELMRTNVGAGARAAYRGGAGPSNVYADQTG
ncbi:MAG: hypothetical protein SGJ11_16955 [Phycisphaerae bacterium]|nr:hypothetical protein [Phycisphaerae bacterium]